jgi:hypothetical protein
MYRRPYHGESQSTKKTLLDFFSIAESGKGLVAQTTQSKKSASKSSQLIFYVHLAGDTATKLPILSKIFVSVKPPDKSDDQNWSTWLENLT